MASLQKRHSHFLMGTALLIVLLIAGGILMRRIAVETAHHTWQLQVTALDGKSVDTNLDMRLSDEELLATIRSRLEFAFPRLGNESTQQEIGAYICRTDKQYSIDRSTPRFVSFDASQELPFALGTLQDPERLGRYATYDLLKSREYEDFLQDVRLANSFRTRTE